MDERDAVVLRNLAIGYHIRSGRQRTVADGINATIRRGELTCLIGSNGVGKSTLLRTLAHFQPRLDGDILIKGRSIDTLTPADLARLIGVVLTERPHVVNTTALDMALMGRSPYTGFWGRYSVGDRRIAQDAIATVGISNLADRNVATLSDGERQKVMIAKALAQQTPIIYMDEPTAFLDYTSKVDIMRLLRHICHENNSTVFLSTHDLELALRMADTVWFFNTDSTITIGSPQQLAASGILPRFLEDHGVRVVVD